MASSAQAQRMDYLEQQLTELITRQDSQEDRVGRKLKANEEAVKALEGKVDDQGSNLAGLKIAVKALEGKVVDQGANLAGLQASVDTNHTQVMGMMNALLAAAAVAPRGGLPSGAAEDDKACTERPTKAQVVGAGAALPGSGSAPG
jgi:chromosome segregation ATPase